MKALIPFAAALLLVCSCNSTPEQKVMARAVPERADDFVFENDLIAGRFYGEALEGNPTSPGLDIWVKLPGALVADTWYAEAMKDGTYYHRDHGGKDCYKVAVSLGGGASVPIIYEALCYPPTNYRASEVVELTPDKVVFTLDYPEWEAAEGILVSLHKKVTVVSGSYFIDVEDTYKFSGKDSLMVAAGFKLHGDLQTVERELPLNTDGKIAIWEKASDQSVEPEDGMIGVGLVCPGADIGYAYWLDHAIAFKLIASGESLCYKVGSCWSKGDIKTADDWFALVQAQ
ncbi:MAG: DUF4861 family protein [Bacteroidales bacterium]|nr:DUF4861 family protein [Bacteroidales bacterium]